MQVFIANGTPVELFTFHWSRELGDCYDCGLPAAFFRDGTTDDSSRLCAICAANSAALGSPIVRIDGDV